MRRPLTSCVYLLALFFISACSSPSADSTQASNITPTSPPSLTILASGQELRFDPPELKTFQALTKQKNPQKAPKDYTPNHEKSNLWPSAIGLTPLYDPTGTHIFGGLFRSFRPETLSVTSESGQIYQRDVDFKYNEPWGQIANIEGRMQGKIIAKAEAALQRLDLIQQNAEGELSVKKGTSVWVCPTLPTPDSGQTAVAGIYIAPWRVARNPFFDDRNQDLSGATEYAITEHEILPISDVAPVAPVRPAAVQSTREKLQAGKTVRVALLGDSLVLGAESTKWWQDEYNEKSLTWRGIFIHTLRQRFPEATVEPIEAYRGGETIQYGLDQLEKVKTQNPDLAIIAFGANDAHRGTTDQPPMATPEFFAESLRSLVTEFQQAGIDVIVVTTYPLNPWLINRVEQHLAAEYIPLMESIAEEQGVALADVRSEYFNLNHHGIPWWSQWHSWVNHPGNLGHGVYADTILRFFESSQPAE